LIIQIISDEEYKSWSSLLFSFLQSSGTFLLIGPDIAQGTLFSNILNVKVSHPYKSATKDLGGETFNSWSPVAVFVSECN
jgi:hypothetical protein